jgi:hypothetical protein
VGTLSDSPSLGSRPCGQPIRRRGTKLTHAIYLATLNELAETSFEELSFDRIAIRAGAGKASLYRRWSSPKELLLEALTDPSAGFGTPRPPDTGSVRSDAVRPRIAAVGPRLLIAEHMDSGTVTKTEIEAVVTEILLPLVTVRPPIR